MYLTLTHSLTQDDLSNIARTRYSLSPQVPSPRELALHLTLAPHPDYFLDYTIPSNLASNVRLLFNKTATSEYIAIYLNAIHENLLIPVGRTYEFTPKRKYTLTVTPQTSTYLAENGFQSLTPTLNLHHDQLPPVISVQMPPPLVHKAFSVPIADFDRLLQIYIDYRLYNPIARTSSGRVAASCEAIVRGLI